MIVRATRWLGGGAVLAFALALAACAPIAPPVTGSAPPPAATPGTGASTPSEPSRRETPAPAQKTVPGAVPGAVRMSAASDSGPTAEAERVLSTIPEPLGGAPPVPPPAPAARDTARAIRAVAPEAASDTLRASRPADDDGGTVPVPEPTTPLRSTPVTVAPVDSSAARPPASPPESRSPGNPATPTNETPPASPPPPSGECFRLQVAAPAEREKAESRRSAAQSLLTVPMVIEREKGLYKVRTRDCLSREAADALRHRASESGFTGAFVIPGKPAR